MTVEIEAPTCHECGVDKVVGKVGHVVHEPDCEYGKEMERKRFDYWERVARLDRMTRDARYQRLDFEREKERRLAAPVGHQFIVISTGHHNPKNPSDWCYRIHCECGEHDDLAWSYEDACDSRDEHRKEMGMTENNALVLRERRTRPKRAAPVPSASPARSGQRRASRTPPTAPAKPQRLVY